MAESLFITEKIFSVSNALLAQLSRALGGALPNHEDYDKFKGELVVCMERSLAIFRILNGILKGVSSHVSLTTIDRVQGVATAAIQHIVHLSEIDHHVVTSIPDNNANSMASSTTRRGILEACAIIRHIDPLAASNSSLSNGSPTPDGNMKVVLRQYLHKLVYLFRDLRR